AQKYNKPINGFAPDAMKALATASWPGNERQLHNVIEQVSALATMPLIPLTLVQRALRVPTVEVLNLNDERQRFEREYLVGLLKRPDGGVADASRLAGRSRTDFYRRLHRHGVTPGRLRGDGPGE